MRKIGVNHIVFYLRFNNSKKPKKRVSLRLYIYLFLIASVLITAISTLIICYKMSVKQLDRYYDSVSLENSRNASSFIDGDYLKELREAIDTEEYQTLREKAEENDDEVAIKEYLKEHGLWAEFEEIQSSITRYMNNISTIRYLYIVANNEEVSTHDMYLIDDASEPLYEVGYYEPREPEFEGCDLFHMENAILSYSDKWGWLYSSYYPVYDSEGECIAFVGCDVELTQVIDSRHKLLSLTIGWIVLMVVISTVIILSIVNKFVVRPLESIAVKIKEFQPHPDMTLSNSGIIEVKSPRTEEIYNIVDSVQTLQMNVIDYISRIEAKDEEISALNQLSMRDSLTGVGNVHGYKLAMGDIGKDFARTKFALLMADINNLKVINDTYGHKEGDKYIQNCCKILCDTFKHSAVFRIGGDEFVVLVQNEDYAERRNLYTKLKLTFDSNYWNSEAPVNKRYSMSIGIGEKRDDDVTIDRMFREADRMMYENKRKLKDAPVR